MPRDSSGSRLAIVAIAVPVLAAGLWLRAVTFDLPHHEGDERIYGALAEQLRDGRGYTLHGHPILDEGWIVREQYDTPLFYHPPGGIAWLALFSALFGGAGFDLAELAAFAVFFCGTFLLAREVLPRWTVPVATVVSVLAAATPIVAHVSVHHWLDGPQLAAVTLAAFLFVRASRSESTGWAAAAGLAFGAACLVKMSAVIALPGIAALAWATSEGCDARSRRRVAMVAVAVAAVLVAPWLVAEFRAFGTLMPSWAGKPSARLVAENPFVRHMTVVRTPWAYVRLLPQTVWTLVPALALLVVLRPHGRSRRVALALAVWIAVVVGVAMALGAIGYSKLLRYVVLMAPAGILLAGLAAGQAIEALRIARGRAIAGALIIVLAVAVALEVAQGIQVARVYPDLAAIPPPFGEAR
jgi:4-amino-4-deoxy-L-arabinose transferase-like glycosyltransferase